MKKIILFATLVFSSSIFAANVEWSDLEEYNDYKLALNMIFENGVNLPAGETYELLEVEALSIPGYPMMYYGFHKKDCTLPDQAAEMSIVEIPGQDWDVKVGAQLEVGCNLGLYVEVKDLYSVSAFTE